MGSRKCSHCHRCGDCSLQDLAVLTLPWVRRASATKGSDWDRSYAVRRALRGTGGGSPGFVEDWLFEGAMTEENMKDLIDIVLSPKEVDIETLTQFCRHYIGPTLHDDSEERKCSAA